VGVSPRVALLLTALLAASAPAQGRAAGHPRVRHSAAATMATAPEAPHLVVGERLSFHGRWLGIPVGTGRIEVTGVVEIDGRSAYAIEAEGSSNDLLSAFYPVHDVLRSYLDVQTLQPVRFEKIQREGRYRADEVVTFDYTRLIATYTSRLNHSVKEIPIPPDVQDILGAFYWLRRHADQPRTTLTLNIYSDEKVFRTDFQVLEPVTLELRRRGTFECLLIEPHARFRGVFVRRGRLWVHLSADARRLPLLINVATPWGPMSGVIDKTSLSTSHR